MPELCAYHSINPSENKSAFRRFCRKISSVLENRILPNSDNTGFISCGGRWEIVADPHKIRMFKIKVYGSNCHACNGYLKKAKCDTDEKMGDDWASLAFSTSHHASASGSSASASHSSASSSSASASSSRSSPASPRARSSAPIQPVGDREDIDYGVRLPNEFRCPISHKIMRSPMLCSDGYSYEWMEIVGWLIDNDLSPITREPISICAPNHALKSMIDKFIAREKRDRENSVPQ